MSSFRNRMQIEGNLGKDAVTRTTQNGDVVNFSVAVNERWIDKKSTKHERTDWFDVEVWGASTKFAGALKKGAAVVVEGKVRTGDYVADDVKHKSWSIVARSIRKIDYEAFAPEINLDAEDAESQPSF